MLGSPAGFRDPIEPNPYFVLSCQVDDVDAQFARAKAAGARIEKEPIDEPYGIRIYRCFDPFGHAWWFYTPTRMWRPRSGARSLSRQPPDLLAIPILRPAHRSILDDEAWAHSAYPPVADRAPHNSGLSRH